ncbi:MAG: hypothetical protein IJA17_07520 [Oscillospiraceae bacterium]|nr:hypothetical protein [Oscillospiraceae bacterium]
MIVQTSGAKRILELGTFTGYSAISLPSGEGGFSATCCRKDGRGITGQPGG